MKKENISVAEFSRRQIKKYKTAKNTYADFPVGTRVKIIVGGRDFHLFNGEPRGIVTENTPGEYAGIRVLIEKEFELNFYPSDLVPVLETVYLLFGHMQDCDLFIREKRLDIGEWVHVSRPDCYYGRRGVKLQWCGPFNFHYDKLYQEAQKYFKSIGEIKS